VAWTDFNYVEGRYAIDDRDAAFKMASEVSASIASSVTKSEFGRDAVLRRARSG
jgi:hypothetical protein